MIILTIGFQVGVFVYNLVTNLCFINIKLLLHEKLLRTSRAL